MQARPPPQPRFSKEASTITVLPDPFSLVQLDCIDSTNDEAGRLAALGARDATVVWALEQTAGRGRRARTWVSPKGNLYCSLLLRPECSPGQSAQLGFIAADSIAEAVSSVLPATARLTCKWPNDVLVNGRKIAGVMLEAEISNNGHLDWLVVGSGLNIESHPLGLELAATSLLAEGCDKEKANAESMLKLYCRHFRNRLAVWQKSGFASVRQAWLERAHGLGSEIMVRAENEVLSGIFQGLDDNGALMLEQNGTKRLITAGDVYLPSAGGRL